LIGSGVVAGNAVMLLFVYLSDEFTIGMVDDALLITSGVMLTVACWRASSLPAGRCGSIRRVH
jgi:hypothetical protein